MLFKKEKPEASEPVHYSITFHVTPQGVIYSNCDWSRVKSAEEVERLIEVFPRAIVSINQGMLLPVIQKAVVIAGVAYELPGVAERILRSMNDHVRELFSDDGEPCVGPGEVFSARGINGP